MVNCRGGPAKGVRVRGSTKVNWAKLYASFSAPLCDVNCGTLCAPDNGGIPACCENEYHMPVLFTDEYRWVKSRTDLWRKAKKKEVRDGEYEEIEEYLKYAVCQGVSRCQRRYRSLTCRFFPLEPYIDKKGVFQGLTWIYRAKDSCPLIENKKITLNQRWTNQAIGVWRELFRAFPMEWECYFEESAKLRKKMKRKKKKIALFQEIID